MTRLHMAWAAIEGSATKRRSIEAPQALRIKAQLRSMLLACSPEYPEQIVVVQVPTVCTPWVPSCKGCLLAQRTAVWSLGALLFCCC